MGAPQSVGFAPHELPASAAVLRDQTGVDQDLDVLLHGGEADRIEPAELADGVGAAEGPRHDVPPCRVLRAKNRRSVRAPRSRVSTTIWLDYPCAHESRAAAEGGGRWGSPLAVVVDQPDPRGVRSSDTVQNDSSLMPVAASVIGENVQATVARVAPPDRSGSAGR